MPANFRGPGDEQYLNKKMVKSLDEYKMLFSNLTNERMLGDVSPDYLYYYEKSIKMIHQILGDVRIIIILRNPVERAYSQYLHFLRFDRETLSFEEALNDEERRKKLNWEWAWFYKDVGLYYNQVKAYIDNFSRVKVYLYDDLKSDALSVIHGIYRFLEIDDSFVPDNLNLRFNISGKPKSKWLHTLINKPNSTNTVLRSIVKSILPKEKRQELKYRITKRNLDRAAMPQEAKEYLRKFYREDVLKLQDLINRDLSQWIN